MAVSDLHASFPANREIVAALRPDSPQDWLLVAGDTSEKLGEIRWALATLSERYAKVIWVPGNHDLWTPKSDQVQLRGAERYERLVGICRDLGVLTPEDPYPVWDGPGGPVTIAPLFLLYDYSFLPAGAATSEEALTMAYDTGIVCTDEMLLYPDPYPSREAWCAARVAQTRDRLDALDPAARTILVNHFPLVRAPTDVLRYPVFAQWCGTTATADWHVRYRAACVVYGHLHIPRTTWYDGVRFEEVSYGYPREWSRRGPAPGPPRQIWPAPEH
jgi:3',5'-cyclic AMP phosphodiesterase CpdA